MRMAAIFKIVLALGCLAGCAEQSPPSQPVPLVAIPGPDKTEAQFRQDDAACRAQAIQQPVSAPTQPTVAQPGSNQEQVAADPAGALPPGVLYLRCMTARQNAVEPLAPPPPVLYSYYADYPIYAGIGFGFPFFYDSFLAFNFYHGGYGRFHGGYGYRGYGNYGYRNYGFREGGFHHDGFGGGGFRGGGFGGGGFHGGGRH